MIEAEAVARVLKRLPVTKYDTWTVLEAHGGRGRIARQVPWGYYLVELPWDQNELPRVGVPPILADLLKVMEEDGVTFRLEEGTLLVEGQRGSYSVSIFDEEVLPPEPEVELKEALELGKGAKAALEAAIGVAKKLRWQNTDPSVDPKAVRVRVENGVAEVSGTDGYHLKVFTLPGTGEGEVSLSVEEVADFLRLVEEEDTIRIGHGAKGELVLEAAYGKEPFTRKALAVIPKPRGNAPDWRRLALEERVGSFRYVGAKALQEAVDRALVLAGKNTLGALPVEIAATPQGLLVRAGGTDGRTEELIPGEGDGAFSVDGRLLLSLLEHVEGSPELSVYSMGGGKKVLVVRLDGRGYLGMVALLDWKEVERGEGAVD